MKQEQVTLRCEDGAEAVVFNKYHFYTNNDTNDFNYEIMFEDSYIGGDYKGFFGRIKRAWRAFWDKPVVYTGIYCEDKDKMKKFLFDCIKLIYEEDVEFIKKDYEQLKGNAENKAEISGACNVCILGNGSVVTSDDSVTSNEELIKKGEW